MRRNNEITGAPPGQVIAAAEAEARRSPCAKSKRGVAIFDARIHGSTALQVAAVGHNRPPGDVVCDGSPACRQSCGKRCRHAESLAIADLGVVGCPGEFDLVHVKIGTDGRIVPGGGPSCWQCAREVLDVQLGGVWLFEQTDCPSPDCPMCSGEICNLCGAGAWNTGLVTRCEHAVDERHHDAQPPQGEWKRYTAAEFWAATCRACEVHP